jgi:hypothetical protein
MNRQASWAVAVLLAMLATLMVAHLALLHNNSVDCSRYLDFLFRRLDKVQVGSPEALALRKELQQTYSGTTVECANLESDFSEAADRYVRVLLALLGGGAIAVTTGRKD